MENDEGQTKLVETKFEKTGEIELPSLDISPYIGKRVKIEKVSECIGEFGECVKVETEIVDTLTMKTNPPKIIDLRGSHVFGLQKDSDGRIGWGEKTKMGVFLKKMKVKHYKDLKGKEVILQAKTSKKGGEFLDFN
jgi:hypothetical protein